MKPLMLFALAIAALGLASCNTISGIGKDVQQFGGGLSSKAEGGTYKSGAISTNQ